MATQSKQDKPRQAGIWATSTSRLWDKRNKKVTNHRIRQNGKKTIQKERRGES
jgi:hypothetical protein